MITIQNIQEFFDNLSEKQINEVMQCNKDFVLCEISFTNVCVWYDVTSMDYSEETENDANDNGQLFCDKDTFVQLYKESESLNPFLMEYL
jgi:hypothetical protein